MDTLLLHNLQHLTPSSTYQLNLSIALHKNVLSLPPTEADTLAVTLALENISCKEIECLYVLPGMRDAVLYLLSSIITVLYNLYHHNFSTSVKTSQLGYIRTF